jgi:hypothetical protein
MFPNVNGNYMCIVPNIIYLHCYFQATDDEVFEAARAIVIAEIQAITFNEFLPALLGQKIPSYKGYNPTVNVDAGNSFATAAFRYKDKTRHVNNINR